MAKYGNILTVYNCTPAQVDQVKTACNANGVISAIKENTFFIETTSKTNTTDLIKAITLLNAEFIFFHNNISDGSKVESNKIEPEFIASVNKILFE
ncbi:MAG TPA: hypothetical protein VJY62_19895 [Bacteroidia bacterium]|nr:hypothetical protein [Bacteroidia bacterium]